MEKKCSHAFMPPRTVPLRKRRITINKRTFEFDDIRSKQPARLWKTRWCLFCLEEHPADAA